MASIAKQISDSLSSLQGTCGFSITYTRGDRAVTLTAVPGVTQYETESGDIIESAQSRDFIILASDLKFGATAVLPERGDTIREVIDGIETTYEVTSPSGVKHFSFVDYYRRVLKIHTTQTDQG